MIRVSNINWDTDGEEVFPFINLPTEFESDNPDLNPDNICDYLSDKFGFCIFNFDIDEYEEENEEEEEDNREMTLDEMWDTLMNYGVYEQTLRIVTDINGYNTETMEDILYAHMGLRSFDQLD